MTYGTSPDPTVGPEPIVVDADRPDPKLLEQAGAALRGGALVAFPTETVYGLGAALDSPDAIERVFRAKGRPATDPLIVHGPSVEAFDEVVRDWPVAARTLAAALWPGPLTMVLARGPMASDLVTAGGDAVGVRMPAHPVALGLLRAAAVPVVAPSANRFGRISPTSAADVVAELADGLDAHRDLILDGGSTPLGIESTVIDLTASTPRILRHGGVPWEDLVDLIGPVAGAERLVESEKRAATVPGAFLRHYAPTTPLVLVEGDDALIQELMASVRAAGVSVTTVGLSHDPDVAARDLYRLLRAADRGDAQVLLAGALRADGLGRAVNDRLFRAAHGRVVTDAGGRSVDRVTALARN